MKTRVVSLHFAFFFKDIVERPDRDFDHLNSEMLDIFDAMPQVIPNVFKFSCYTNIKKMVKQTSYCKLPSIPLNPPLSIFKMNKLIAIVIHHHITWASSCTHLRSTVNTVIP